MPVCQKGSRGDVEEACLEVGQQDHEEMRIVSGQANLENTTIQET